MANGRPFGGRFAAPASGRGRMGGLGLGPGGECRCVTCGDTVIHTTGRPCYEMKSTTITPPT